MSPSIDEIVERAYKSLDSQSDFKIPKIEKWKKTNKTGYNKVSACKDCGSPILHAPDKHPTHCANCKKKVSDLAKIKYGKKYYSHQSSAPKNLF
jgi:DNA-directed RNA polymerase subunit RPC12/RpoP